MVRPRRTNRTERTDECASNESVIQRQAEETPYNIHHCCGIILDENDTSYKRRIFLKYLPELFEKKKKKTRSGISASIRAVVAISWDQKHKETILNFRVVVVQRPQMILKNVRIF